MSQAIDIFELSVDVIFRCCGWVLPEKYFTFELDIMVGTIIKMIGFVYSFTFLDIYQYVVLAAYFYFWVMQTIFIALEYEYIFKGKSDTKKRKYTFKVINCFQSGSAMSIYFNMNINAKPITIVQIFASIILCLFVIDILEIIIFLKCKNNQTIESEDYESVGFSYEFLKFRIIGGIIGIIVVLIIYIIFLVSVGYEYLIFRYLPCVMIFSEIINLVSIILQINKKRRKEKLKIDDKTKKKLKLKKWYCIIIGFSSGLVGVITSCTLQIFFILQILFQWIFCFFRFKSNWKQTKKIFVDLIILQPIIDYEIQEISQVQEDQLNQTSQV